MKYYDADEDPDRRPVRLQRPKRLRCGQRGCRRDVESDGYGELVHSDTGLYQCDPSDSRFRMAMLR